MITTTTTSARSLSATTLGKARVELAKDHITVTTGVIERVWT